MGTFPLWGKKGDVASFIPSNFARRNLLCSQTAIFQTRAIPVGSGLSLSKILGRCSLKMKLDVSRDRLMFLLCFQVGNSSGPRVIFFQIQARRQATLKRLRSQLPLKQL